MAGLPRQIIESLIECKQGVGGRREPELSVAFQAFPLAQQIQAQAARRSFGRYQRISSNQGKRETRNTLNAFVRRGDQEIGTAPKLLIASTK